MYLLEKEFFIMKDIKSVKTYLANLYVGNVYLHNLHWNVVGPNFKAVHEYLESLYDENFEFIDEFAELMIMQGCKPEGSMKQYLEETTIKEITTSNDLDEQKAISLALDYVETMKELALKIREEADEKDLFPLANMMEDHLDQYYKEIWFMKSMKK